MKGGAEKRRYNVIMETGAGSRQGPGKQQTQTRDMTIFRSYTRAAVGADKESRKVSGTPIVFGKRSVLMYDADYGTCYETIERGAITPDLLQGDIVACINHDPSQILARSTGGEGSLHLEIGEDGVRMEFDAPDTCYGNVAYEGCMRGDFQGMSFGFVSNPDEDWSYTKEKDDDGKPVYVRHVNKIRGLFDVSIVTHPAYPDTGVEARSLKAEFAKAEAPHGDEVRNADMLRDFDEIGKFIGQ